MFKNAGHIQIKEGEMLVGVSAVVITAFARPGSSGSKPWNTRIMICVSFRYIFETVGQFC